MKITIEDPTNLKDYNYISFYTDLIYLILIGNEIYLDKRDIEIQNTSTDISISLFKCEQSLGCGTKEHRDNDWANIKSTVDSLFGSLKQYRSWRWVKYHSSRYTKPQDTDCIEGIKIIVPKGTKVTF